MHDIVSYRIFIVQRNTIGEQTRVRRRTISVANAANRQSMTAFAGDIVHNKVAARTLLRVKHAFWGCRVACRDDRDAVVSVGDDLDTVRQRHT